VRADAARTPHPNRSRQLASNLSLRVRLLLAITVALSPIAVASFIQGMDRAERDTANVSDRLLQTTKAAASSEENMLAAAEQIARALANLPQVRAGGSGCDAALTDSLKGLVFFTNLSRIDRTGKIVCAAQTLAVGRNVRMREVWRRAKASTDFTLSEQITSQTTNRPVIVGMLPLYNAKGFDGVIAITIDVRWLDYMVHAKRLPEGAVVAIFDRQGQIIASNQPGSARPIFAHANDVREVGKDLYTALDADANKWLYSTAPLLGSSVYVGFAMRESKLFGATYLHVGTDFILPFIMLALSWFAIWLVTERQITRWIIYLRRVAAAYRSGHYAFRPALEDAATEIRLLGDAMSDMAAAIDDRDRRLREALDEKTTMIREIHHRVKNNLQIVMSILSLEARLVGDPATKETLKRARARVNALALVHKILNQIEDQTTVDLKPIIEALVEQTREGLAGDRPGLHIQTDVVQRRVPGNLAMPLSLFTVEALTNAFKYAFPERTAQGKITVILAPAEDRQLRLAVVDDGMGCHLDGADRSVGLKLIETFGQQVGGHTQIHSAPGKGTVAELIFPEPDLQAGAGRQYGQP
jgi:two-component sensor histidine kinase